MGCDQNTGVFRELGPEEEAKEGEAAFKVGEILEIKGCTFEVVAIHADPFNKIVLGSIPKQPEEPKAEQEKEDPKVTEEKADGGPEQEKSPASEEAPETAKDPV